MFDKVQYIAEMDNGSGLTMLEPQFISYANCDNQIELEGNFTSNQLEAILEYMKGHQNDEC